MHLLIYQERPDVNGGLPRASTTRHCFRCCRTRNRSANTLRSNSDAWVRATRQPTALLRPTKLTEAMRPLVKHHNALLMANHGAVAYGADLWQAFDRLETLEHTARIAILSRILGGSKNLPADAIEKLINVREAAGYLGEGAVARLAATYTKRSWRVRPVIVLCPPDFNQSLPRMGKVELP